MPGPSGLLPPFSTAVTQDAVEKSTYDAYPDAYVKTIILELSTYLLTLVDYSLLFGKPANDPYSPSLRTIYDRLHNGCLAPSPLREHANNVERIKSLLAQRQRTHAEPMLRPLEDFEDMYYAVLARMLDIHQVLNARLGSGFNIPPDPVFPTQDIPTISSLFASLSQYWDVLNDVRYAKALDNAIRRSRVTHLHQEILLQLQNNDITQADASELLNDLYDPSEYSGVQGLAWIGGWAPSMISAWLEEKYRCVLGLEKEEETRMAMAERRKAKTIKKGKARQEQSSTVPKHGIQFGAERLEDKQQSTKGKLHGQQENQDPEQLRLLRKDVQDTLDWQLKWQRVSEYSQYLRGMASPDARHQVQTTIYGNDMRMGMLSGEADQVNGDVDMETMYERF